MLSNEVHTSPSGRSLGLDAKEMDINSPTDRSLGLDDIDGDVFVGKLQDEFFFFFLPFR